jgi:hypothetical protein
VRVWSTDELGRRAALAILNCLDVNSGRLPGMCKWLGGDAPNQDEMFRGFVDAVKKAMRVDCEEAA